MPKSFSHTEIQLVQTYLAVKPEEYIAMLLDRPVDEVKEMITELTGGGTIRKTFRQLQLQKQLKKVNEKRFREQDKLEEKRRNGTPLNEKCNNKRAPLFQTKVVDYSKMISVRIDAKTIIQVKPGTNIYQVKTEFIEKRKQRLANTTGNTWTKLK